MRVVAIGMVRNEIDIVEAFVRHALAMVDQLVLLDNGSHDGTLDVLHSLQREGLALEVIEDSELGKRQAERTTRLMREYAIAKHGADWVVPIDADEFLIAGPDGFIPPETPADRPILIPWRSYVPEATDDAAERNPVLRIRHRLRTEGWPWVKVMVPRSLAGIPGAQLSEGNHSFQIGDAEVKSVPCPGSFLGHFPIRGPGQYLAKVAIGYLNRLLVAVRQSDWGFQYRGPFERLKRDPASVSAEFSEAARRYALPGGATADGETIPDPLAYRGGRLVFTPPFDDTHWPVAALAVFGETTANRCAAYMTAMEATDQCEADRFAAVQEQLYRQLYAKDDSIRAAQEALSAMNRCASETEVRLRDALAEAERAITASATAAEGAAASERGIRALLEQAEREVESMRRTWAWRVGSAAVWPVRRVRQAVSRILRGRENC